MTRRLVKVCGMTDADNLREVIRLEPDLIGIIFYSASPRYVADPAKLAFFNQLASKPLLIGVFVDSPVSLILDTNRLLPLDGLQLHGLESPEMCRGLKEKGFRVIKAFGVGEGFDFRVTDNYTGCCDYFLFDTASPMKGGTGRGFDWSLTEQYTGDTPFLLSGGITADTRNFPRHPRFAGVDLNSRFETAPGIKDIQLLTSFITNYRNETDTVQPG